MTETNLTVRSEAFGPGERIPRRYAREGDDVSPPITWSRPPDGTKELALVCDDPDAPRAQPWVHWLVYSIPPGTHELREGVSLAAPRLDTPDGANQGPNSWGELGWGGPLPPKGDSAHHYHFTLYALDRRLGLGPGADKDALLDAIKDHVLARGELVGTYAR